MFSRPVNTSVNFMNAFFNPNCVLTRGEWGIGIPIAKEPVTTHFYASTKNPAHESVDGGMQKAVSPASNRRRQFLMVTEAFNGHVI